MKYHPEILYAKYHFVRRVGWHLKIKKYVQKWSKIDPEVQNGNACRINEAHVLLFNRGDI